MASKLVSSIHEKSRRFANGSSTQGAIQSRPTANASVPELLEVAFRQKRSSAQKGYWALDDGERGQKHKVSSGWDTNENAARISGLQAIRSQKDVVKLKVISFHLTTKKPIFLKKGPH